MLRRLLRKLLFSADRQAIERHERRCLAQQLGLIEEEDGGELPNIQDAEEALGITDSVSDPPTRRLANLGKPLSRFYQPQTLAEQRSRMEAAHRRIDELLDQQPT